MFVLLFACLLVFQTACCMTEAQNAKPGSKTDLMANASFIFSLDQALKSCSYNIVKAIFDNKSKDIDMKSALNLVDCEGDAMLARAIKKGCGLDILKFLKQQGAQICGMAGEKPTLRRAIANRLYTQEERIMVAEWLIQEDDTVIYIDSNDAIVCKGGIITKFIESMRSVVQDYRDANTNFAFQDGGTIEDAGEEAVINDMVSVIKSIRGWYQKKAEAIFAKDA